MGADGGVFAFGDAGYFGSLQSLHLTPASPIVGIAATPTGKGYWLVGADGGVFAFGDAGYFGNVATLLGAPAPSPIVGMAATPDGGGYWVVRNDGAVSRFGDAGFFGSTLTTGIVPTAPVVGIVATPDAKGYWLVGGDGGVFTFGDAGYFGSLPAELATGGVTLASPVSVVGLASRPEWSAGARTAPRLVPVDHQIRRPAGATRPRSELSPPRPTRRPWCGGHAASRRSSSSSPYSTSSPVARSSPRRKKAV